MAEHATAIHSGACAVRFKAASQLDGKSVEGPAMTASPSDSLSLLSITVLPNSGRQREPTAEVLAERLCFAGAICSQWISHHHTQHDTAFALHRPSCKGDDHQAPSH